MGKRLRSPWFRTVLLAMIVFGIVIFGSLVSFLTDYRWFQELGFTGTFLTRLRTQMMIGIPMFLALLALSNLYLIRLKNRYFREVAVIEDPVGEKKIVQAIRVGSMLLSLLLSISVSSRVWFDLLSYLNGQNFGQVDPIFSRDEIGRAHV